MRIIAGIVVSSAFRQLLGASICLDADELDLTEGIPSASIALTERLPAFGDCDNTHAHCSPLAERS
jgi:hypothetical protein